MKSLKNHLSLIVALATVLFTVQVFTIIERSITSYEERLKHDYSIIIVAVSELQENEITSIHKLIRSSEAIPPDKVINEFKNELHGKNLELLKMSLPKFYRIGLKRFPTPEEIDALTKNLKRHTKITRVEDFAHNHDMVYKLLVLVKQVIAIFAASVFAVTALLIVKELRLWQFQHQERMSIMALFGAPLWMRSAVLYRLAIVDAFLATLLVNATFFFIVKNGWAQNQLNAIGISVDLYRINPDGLILGALALGISVVLATLIVTGHKEEA